MNADIVLVTKAQLIKGEQTMDRIQEIDQLIGELYDKVHEAIRRPDLGYRTDGIVDGYIEQIAQLKVERAYWANR